MEILLSSSNMINIICNYNIFKGFCKHPELCHCRPGWEGQDCSQCIKKHGCLNGNCNKPFECICEDGWKGDLCDAREDAGKLDK